MPLTVRSSLSLGPPHLHGACMKSCLVEIARRAAARSRCAAGKHHTTHNTCNPHIVTLACVRYAFRINYGSQQSTQHSLGARKFQWPWQWHTSRVAALVFGDDLTPIHDSGSTTISATATSKNHFSVCVTAHVRTSIRTRSSASKDRPCPCPGTARSLYPSFKHSQGQTPNSVAHPDWASF